MHKVRWAVLVLGALLLAVGASAWTATHQAEPVATADDAWESLRQRPLTLPTLSPDVPCPVTSTHEVLPGQRLPGDGPIYPQVQTDREPIHYGGSVAEGGWYFVKILWRASGDYRGPALIRGRQLDGANELRFERGPNPPAELQFPVQTGVQSTYTVSGWRDNPSYIRIRAPGCYAWQIDGLNFRQVIAFRAEP